MSILEHVAEELDSFIDQDDGITPETLAHAPTITALLAHGDPEQAYLVIDGIRKRNVNRDVGAAFAHLGGFGYKGNTEDRLNAYALEQHAHSPKGQKEPSSRSVRRWSSSGQRILASLIVQASGVEPPTLHLDVLRRQGTTLIVLPTIYHMHGYVMNDPVLIVVGAEAHAIQIFSREDMETVGEHKYQPEHAVEVDVGFPVHLQLIWLGEMQPVIVSRTINFPDDVIEMTSLTRGATGLALYRDGDDIDSLAELAAELGRLNSDAAEEHDGIGGEDGP
ncbi:hypothetical protein [Nocardia gamkensis]|uniref:Uncharacterized protein n=1 Tax=Nocardia gamkensis TaxID=352869 RepID=A0A7X6L4K3_9NOCA|nr:hypothetical protein [Nocardia gamkensis]NKY27736.1 hypothetical protein [Nocardia gamkensis]NQE67373.1 hypothetical protein [Nocardia gamkensis]